MLKMCGMVTPGRLLEKEGSELALQDAGGTALSRLEALSAVHSARTVLSVCLSLYPGSHPPSLTTGGPLSWSLMPSDPHGACDNVQSHFKWCMLDIHLHPGLRGSSCEMQARHQW